MNPIYNKPILTTKPGNNDKYINQLKVLNRYDTNQPQLRTTANYDNNLSQFTANNNIQKELINDYNNNQKKRYVNIDDNIDIYNPNIEYNKYLNTYTNTTLRFVDHYINIDSSLRRKEPLITYDGNYINLSDKSLKLIKDSSLLYVKCNSNLKVNDKIILEGVTPKVSKFINTDNLVLTENSSEVTITINDKDIMEIFPDNDNDIYLKISNYTNFDVFTNQIEYIGNVPLTLINDVHKFKFTKYSDHIVIKFNIPFNYHKVEQYQNSTIVRTFNIIYFFYYNVPIYNLNATYPISSYAKKHYHVIKEVDNQGFYIDIDSVSENDLVFGDNVRIRKIKKYEKGYEDPNSYVLELTETYKNIIGVEMISSEFPNTNNTIFKNKSIKTNIIQGYNDYNKEITYTQNNKLYWQNQNDGSYIYSVEIEPGKYSIDNLIKEIEDKVYNTPKYYYSDIQLFNNHNVIKITYELDKDLVTFRSFNEYDCNFIRCDKEGNEDNNGEYMKFDLEYHNSTILLDDQYYPITNLSNNTYITNYINTSATHFYTPNIFRLLFNYQDTFGTLLGFNDVGKETSITQFNSVITNKMNYSPMLGFVLENDKINIGDNINLTGDRYLIIVCKEFPVMDNVFNVSKNQAFNKILLYGVGKYVEGTNYGDYMGGGFVYDSFIKIKKIYYTPIHEVSKLSFEFYSPSGELVDFKGIDHSFTLKITTLENILDNTNINSQTESTI